FVRLLVLDRHRSAGNRGMARVRDLSFDGGAEFLGRDAAGPENEHCGQEAAKREFRHQLSSPINQPTRKRALLYSAARGARASGNVYTPVAHNDGRAGVV